MNEPQTYCSVALPLQGRYTALIVRGDPDNWERIAVEFVAGPFDGQRQWVQASLISDVRLTTRPTTRR